MSGHQARAQSSRLQSRFRDPRRRAVVDDLAAHVEQERAARGPNIRALEDLEQQLLRTFIEVYPGDYSAAGAAALVLGVLLTDLHSKMDAQQRQAAPAIMINLLRMTGERLYNGQLPVTIPCPYPLPGDLACIHVCNAPDSRRADILMRAHVDQHHPGETWPSTPTDDAAAVDAKEDTPIYEGLRRAMAATQATPEPASASLERPSADLTAEADRHAATEGNAEDVS